MNPFKVGELYKRSCVISPQQSEITNNLHTIENNGLSTILFKEI